MEYDESISRNANMMQAVNSGMTEDEFMKYFSIGSRATARLYIYRAQQGLLSDTPVPRCRGRRATALAMFANGEDLDAVVAATGLRRQTASAYRWEQRKMAAYQEAKDDHPEELLRDPLCD